MIGITTFQAWYITASSPVATILTSLLYLRLVCTHVTTESSLVLPVTPFDHGDNDIRMFEE